MVFRYLDNPNGSVRDIAGILNRERNVMGMMPHPERAVGPADGLDRRPCDFPIHGFRVRARMTTITPDLIATHQLTEAEYDKIVGILGREPSLHRARHFQRDVERALLLQELAPASEEAADARQAAWCRGRAKTPGIIDIGGGYVVAFKIESHNHPSFIEPFQGAATGVGGILRDIFTMGARPIAVMDALRFGPLDDPQNGARNRRILEGVVGGHRALRQLFRRADGGRRVRFRSLLQRQSAGERVRAGHVPSTTKSSTPRRRASAIR